MIEVYDYVVIHLAGKAAVALLVLIAVLVAMTLIREAGIIIRNRKGNHG